MSNQVCHKLLYNLCTVVYDNLCNWNMKDKWNFVKIVPQKNEFQALEGDRTSAGLKVAHKSNLGSSTFQASRHSVDGCWFDPVWGTIVIFRRYELEERQHAVHDLSSSEGWRLDLLQDLKDRFSEIYLNLTNDQRTSMYISKFLQCKPQFYSTDL